MRGYLATVHRQLTEEEEEESACAHTRNVMEASSLVNSHAHARACAARQHVHVYGGVRLCIYPYMRRHLHGRVRIYPDGENASSPTRWTEKYAHVSACVCMHGVLRRLCMCAYIRTFLYAVDCVCMGTYPCMYTCMYTYIFVYVCMGTHPCMHVCMHVCSCIYRICTGRVCLCTYPCMHACIRNESIYTPLRCVFPSRISCQHVHPCMGSHTHTQTHTHRHTHTSERTAGIRLALTSITLP
jgi:hypothetical protein